MKMMRGTLEEVRGFNANNNENSFYYINHLFQ